MLTPWISKNLKYFKKKTVLVAIFLSAVFFFCFSLNVNVSAQSLDFQGGIEAVDQNIALSGMDFRIIIVRIINTLLGLLGLLAVSLIIYAGYIWMTSGGDENKITEAKAILRNAVIGLIIILSSFAIVRFLFSVLDGRLGGGEGRGKISSESFYGSGSLGTVIKDHYPVRDQENVARNTSIVVTFAFPVDPASFIINSNNTCFGPSVEPVICDEINKIPYYGDCFDTNTDGIINYSTECDRLNTSSVKIINLAENPELNSKNYSDFNFSKEAVVFASYEDGAQKNIYSVVFKPLEYLGSSIENQEYSVYLSSDIKQKINNESVFAEQYAKFYYWNFDVGTELDLTPPEVVSVSPMLNAEAYRNEILQINFSEAIDPTTVSGDFSSTSLFKNILVNGSGQIVSGKWQISNGYKTVEFISDIPCGQNSCGDMMYCLPITCDPGEEPNCSKPFEVLIKTAESTGNIENIFEAMPFTGVYDLALNSLNNKLNDTSETLVFNYPGSNPSKTITQGQRLADNYWWNFRVKNEIDRSRPYLKSIVPGVDAQELEEDQEISMIFSKIMRFKSLDNAISLKEYPEHICSSFAFDGSGDCEYEEKLDSFWFYLRSTNLTEETKTNVLHRKLGPNQLDLYYFPTVSSSVQSNNQNCLYPGFGPDSDNCEIIFNPETGEVVSKSNCVNVTEKALSDTACAYTNGDSVIAKDENVLKANIESCLDYLKRSDVSPSQYIFQAPGNQ